MKITNEILQNPSHFNVIMFRAGRLTGEKRRHFIQKISEKNLYLAAKCKNGSFSQEQEITQSLINKAEQQIEQIEHQDYVSVGQGVLALDELNQPRKIYKLLFNNSYEEILAIYEAIQSLKIKPPAILSELLVFKAPLYQYAYDFAFGDDLYDLTKRTYTHIINRAPNNKLAYEAYEELKKSGIQFNQSAFHALINKAKSYEQAFNIFKEMQQNGLIANEITYSTLINKAPYEDAVKHFEEMKNAELKPNEITYSTLINKAPYEDAVKHFEEMKNAELKPNEITYSTLINKAPYEDAVKHFEEMKNAELKPNEITYSTLINKAPYEDAVKHFEEMKNAELKPNEITYNTLINKAPYEDAVKHFEEMQQNGLQPNVITFNTILKKANHSHQPFTIILDLLDKMLALRIKPQAKEGVNQKGRKMKPHTVYTLQSALRKPKNRDQFRAWAEDKRRELQTAPKWLREAWEQFFQKLE